MTRVGPATIETPEYNRSIPARSARVGAFRIEPTEVTESNYTQFLAATGYFPPRTWDNKVSSRRSSKLPVVDTSMVDAMFYCAWRQARLPTWAEWHAAAYGPSGHREPWGRDLPDSDLARGDQLSPVGKHPKSAGPNALPDIVGNAWEWCFGPLVEAGDRQQAITSLDQAVALGGGQLRLHGQSGDAMQGFITRITDDDSIARLFWDAREGLPNAGHNMTIWGATVVSPDFMSVSLGGGAVWFGTPEEDSRRYPRLCVVTAGFAFRSPTVGFRCAANEPVSP